jgi:hypothetical protein
MNRWDKARHEQRVAAISRELGRLLRAQTELASLLRVVALMGRKRRIRVRQRDMGGQGVTSYQNAGEPNCSRR